MTTYLFCSSGWSGHVNPTLPVAQELVARGHHVIFYCTTDFKDLIESSGAVFRLYTSQRETPHFTPSAIPEIGECHFVLEQILDEVRTLRIEMVIYEDSCLWGRLLSRILKLPAALINTTYAGTEEFHWIEYYAQRLHRPAPGLQVTPEQIDIVAHFCKTFHLDLFSIRSINTLTEPLTLVLMPRVFHPREELFDEQHFKFVGPCIYQYPRRNDFPYARLEQQPVLYASLGTLHTTNASVFDTIISAFRHQPQPLILSIGPVLKPEIFGSVPDNVMLHASVPQLEVLEHTDIFITHGGMNSVMEGLYYGVPLVIAPQTREHELTAQKIMELNVGVMLEQRSITTHTLRKAVEQVRSNPDMRRNAQQLQTIIRQAGGYLRAADEIEGYSSRVLNAGVTSVLKTRNT